MSLLSRALSIQGSHLDTLTPPNHIAIPRDHPRSINDALGTSSRSDSSEFPDQRPPKRRKLELRGPRQQTLDSFFSSDPLRPPAKIAQLRPDGPLIETINGVQSEVVTPNGHLSAPVTSVPIPQVDGSIEALRKVPKKIKFAEKQKPTERRALRSQDDGPRLKSQLATYFQNYEDIVFDTLQEPELLNVDSSFYITDDDPAEKTSKGTPSPLKSPKTSKDTFATPEPPKLSHKIRATEVDLSVIVRSIPNDANDPMGDDAYFVSHRRAERKEKQMRNIERAHAMHEKVQLDNLLDRLMGHDWLRVLGLTGITDGEAKRFEPKRDYFIAEVQALIGKFDAWKEEEKRQRLTREAMLAAEREAEDDDDATTSASSRDPPSSDLNMSASRQLQQEAAAARSRKRKERIASLPQVPYRPPSPIKSFYSSKHSREIALKKSRNSRNHTAFGVPIPDLDEQEFALPADYVTEDVLRASARERRRRHREHISTSSSK